MIRIVKEEGVLVVEDALTFLERDSVLPKIDSCLGRVPFEPNLGHVGMYVRCTYNARTERRGLTDRA
jgi:hypothetical protein